MKFLRVDHPRFQPAGIAESEEFFAEENVGLSRRLWQRSQPALDRRHPLSRRQLPGARQPRRPSGGGSRLRGALLNGFQVAIALSHRRPTRQVQESANNQRPPGAGGGEGMLPAWTSERIFFVASCALPVDVK